MKFKNETKEDVLFPVIRNDNLPSSKFIIKDGEEKDVPECAIETAKLYGLTPVELDIKVTETEDSVVLDIKEIELEEVPLEAEESSISEVKIETKQVKKKKSKKTLEE